MHQTQRNRDIGPEPSPRPHRWRLAATVVAGIAIVGTAVGAGVAIASSEPTPSVNASPALPAPTTAPRAKGGKHGGRTADPGRAAWAHRYGVDRATMPNLPDVGAASAEQRAAATDLLERTRAATAPYADLAKAAAAGFDVQASLAKAEKKRPGKAASMQRVDAGGVGQGRMRMLHVANTSNRSDGKVLDPSAPESLMYAYEGGGSWMLVGVMYTANESYPQAPPDPGGPITRWHYHDKVGGDRLMMHVFFAPGNDLAHAYAAEMDR